MQLVVKLLWPLVIVVVQIGRRFFRALSSVDCQQCIVSALIDMAVDGGDLQSAAAAVSCLKQVLMLLCSLTLTTQSTVDLL